jgi:HTH-type transcriptional regulator/antitoxin HigA
MKEIDGLMSAAPDTPEGERLDVLLAMVEAWEDINYPLEPGDL